MEANARVIASTKAGINILNQQNIGGADQDLSEVLDQPMSPDDEF